LRGSPRRYLYRYQVNNPNVGSLDWIIAPCAREFDPGKLSAFTLGYQPHIWGAAETSWRTLELKELIVYEVNIAEFAGDIERTRNLLAYYNLTISHSDILAGQ
jgi:1,4-alpha-glucan branching enzyme